jgi:KipI family sensor histidine kinase inhibitor
MTVSPLGDSAAVIVFGDTVDATMAARVRSVAAEIERQPPAGVVDVVPAFATVAVFFDPTKAAGFEELRVALEGAVARAEAAIPNADVSMFTIPVCYGGEFGPDIESVAANAGGSTADVIALHSGAEYLVHAIGFAPGFPYLGGLPAQLATPRRATPRSRVPAGSVGIGGAQTGIYPLETPGGWNLIGRTPLTLFDAAQPQPALLQAGDRVKFAPISPEEFQRVARGVRDTTRTAPKQENPLENAPAVEVVRAGMFTTVQDLGRRGYRARGVPLSGAADTFALRVANLLVGNAEDAAALEFTLVAPELKFQHDTIIALGGAEFGEVPRWRPIEIAAGTTLKLGPAKAGCRGYLAIAGGIDVPVALGSRSTYVRAIIGGIEGRALRKGDVLPIPEVRRHFRDHWRIDERIVPKYSNAAVVRVIPGDQASDFDDAWRSATFKVSTQSDRMGMRLNGPALGRRVERELVSSPVAPGTIQVPPDGHPIILLADAQTIGGYPRVAHVISVDLPLLAQLRPGDTVRFRAVALADARELIAAQERALGLLREGLAQKLA